MASNVTKEEIMLNGFVPKFLKCYEGLKSFKPLALAIEHKNSKHVKTKRIVVTPTHIYFKLEEPEKSNTITRCLQKLCRDSLIRVSFEDEDGRLPKNLKFLIEERFKKIGEEFVIGGRQFKFLAYSQSQLRSNSCWMFCEDNKEGITIEDIYESIGDFS